MSKRLIICGIIALVLIAGAGFWLMKNNTNNNVVKEDKTQRKELKDARDVRVDVANVGRQLPEFRPSTQGLDEQPFAFQEGDAQFRHFTHRQNLYSANYQNPAKERQTSRGIAVTVFTLNEKSKDSSLNDLMLDLSDIGAKQINTELTRVGATVTTGEPKTAASVQLKTAAGIPLQFACYYTNISVDFPEGNQSPDGARGQLVCGTVVGNKLIQIGTYENKAGPLTLEAQGEQRLHDLVVQAAKGLSITYKL